MVFQKKKKNQVPETASEIVEEEQLEAEEKWSTITDENSAH